MKHYFSYQVLYCLLTCQLHLFQMSLSIPTGFQGWERFAGALSNLAVTAAQLQTAGPALGAAPPAASAFLRAPIARASTSAATATSRTVKINAIKESSNKALDDAKMLCYVRM